MFFCLIVSKGVVICHDESLSCQVGELFRSVNQDFGMDIKEKVKLVLLIMAFVLAVLAVWYFGPLEESTKLVGRIIEWMRRLIAD